MGGDDSSTSSSGFQWQLVLLLFGLLLICLLAIARHLSIQAGVSRYNTSPERRQLWDRRLLSDFTWFALFECIVTIISGTGSARFSMFPVRLFAGIMAFFLLYEFLVPILFPVATTSVTLFTDSEELNLDGTKNPPRTRNSLLITGGGGSTADPLPSWCTPTASSQ